MSDFKTSIEFRRALLWSSLERRTSVRTLASFFNLIRNHFVANNVLYRVPYSLARELAPGTLRFM
jgi:hypothetical protein